MIIREEKGIPAREILPMEKKNEKRQLTPPFVCQRPLQRASAVQSQTTFDPINPPEKENPQRESSIVITWIRLVQRPPINQSTVQPTASSRA